MNPLQHYIDGYKRKKKTISKVIARADGGGLMSCESGTKAHFATRMMQESEFPRGTRHNMVMIDCPLSIKTIMTTLQNKKLPIKLFREMLVGVVLFENNSYNYTDSFLFDEMSHAFKQQKYVFIAFGFKDYDVDNINGENEYCGHSTCALLVPNKTRYDCYYINTHGRDMKTTNYFKTIVTNNRCRVYHYKESLDTVFMKGLCDSFNQISDITIHYNNTYRYTYLGTNFQSGDNHGVCFIFPFIIFHYIGKYLTRSRYFEVDGDFVYMESGIKLMKKGRLGLFVESIFADFTKKYTKILCQKNITYKTKREHLETFVIKNAAHFLKAITSPMVSFMLQSKMKY
jgi:hypothetical protein